MEIDHPSTAMIQQRSADFLPVEHGKPEIHGQGAVGHPGFHLLTAEYRHAGIAGHLNGRRHRQVTVGDDTHHRDVIAFQQPGERLGGHGLSAHEKYVNHSSSLPLK